MSSSSHSSNFNEHRWVIYVQKTLEEDLDDNNDSSITIFTIPLILMDSDPDSYIPHVIAIGPYHHSRPELYQMERYKLAAAKKTQKSFQPIKIHHIVDHFLKFESKIRSCYNKFLDFNGETLAWMMVVDVCFLLEFLQVYADNNDKNLRPRVHSSILRDVMMLENQIPMFLLRKALEFRGETPESADELLLAMIMGISEELSPLKLTGELSPENISVHESAHFVDFLYNLLVPKSIDYTDVVDDQNSTEFAGHLSNARQLFDKMRMKFNQENGLFKTIISSKPVTLAIKLPISIILNLPILNLFKQPLENILFNKDREKKDEEKYQNSNNVNKPPLMEEISIPSVSELVLAGVKFVPTTQNNIMTINFDVFTSTFYLPTVVLEVNTRSILKNLVAYETCASSGPLIFTRYTEMMNGIIDTEEDARLLRERGIIVNHLKTDEEAADLWNGMSKSIKLTKVSFLDQTIENVNKYYRRSWKIKVRKFVNFYILESWHVFLFLAIIMLLFLMGLQAIAIFIGINMSHMNM